MRRLLILLCVVALFPFAALTQTSDQPTGTITVEDNATQDASIAVRIREILGELEGFEDVTVTVSSGIVTLRGTTVDSEAATRLNEIAGRVEGVVAIENEVTETMDVARRLNPAIDRFVARLNQTVAFLPLAAIAVLAFAVVVLLGFAIARLKQPWNRLAPNAFISDIYRQIIRLAFVIGGLVIALDIIGATALLSTILGAAGIIGLAIGFAVRDTVENFIASIMLSIRQPFRPNDTIEIGGDTGKVIRLTSRATILLSFDGNHIRIPNATVFKSRIVNFTRNDERRFLFDLGIAPDTNLVSAKDLARETLESLPFVLDTPAANVWIEDVGDSTVTLRMAAWIAQHETSFVAARGEAIRLVKSALENAGVQMPEPTYRLIMQSLPEAIIANNATKPVPEALERDDSDQEVQDVQATMEQELEQIVDDEREASADNDLLKNDAMEE